MEIKTFVDSYLSKPFVNVKTRADERLAWIKKELEVKEYVSFDEKQLIAKTVLENCSNIRDGVIAIDSIQKYLLFTMAMLSVYTNLSPDDDMGISEAYDTLCSVTVDDGTLLDAIIKTFEVEYSRCNDILNMMTSDLVAENNIEKQIGRFLAGILNKIDGLGDKLSNNLGDIGKNFDQLDIDKLTSMINKIK